MNGRTHVYSCLNGRTLVYSCLNGRALVYSCAYGRTLVYSCLLRFARGIIIFIFRFRWSTQYPNILDLWPFCCMPCKMNVIFHAISCTLNIFPSFSVPKEIFCHYIFKCPGAHLHSSECVYKIMTSFVYIAKMQLRKLTIDCFREESFDIFETRNFPSPFYASILAGEIVVLHETYLVIEYFILKVH